MLNSVKRSSVFAEFSEEEQQKWFSIKEKSVSHHIDTLYYTVSIQGDGVFVSLDGISDFIEYLSILKEQKLNTPSNQSLIAWDLEVFAYGAPGGYTFRLSEIEYFDIFIASKLANKDTPRVMVQLRTQCLIEYGPSGAIEFSLNKVKEILSCFGLFIDKIQENRIDYAFHTNVLQDPMGFFGTESVNNHLLTPFARGGLQFYIAHRRDEDIDIDYFTIGSRKSNYIFFRAYNKVEEVIEQNYKGFFFKMWYDRGLINEYDLYVYSYAFTIGSYKSGILVGRCQWYLEFGKNEDLKEEIQKLLNSYYEKSSNNKALAKAIKGVLPSNTVVFNLEFETKRKYYAMRSGFIDSYKIILSEDKSIEAVRLYKLLDLRREFIEDLTSNYVCFVDNRRNVDPKVLDWWQRVRRVRIVGLDDDALISAWITYSRQLDIKRQKNRFAGNLAALAMIHRNDTSPATLGEDIIDALSLLNDNDIENGDISAALSNIDVSSYQVQRSRKRRQIKPLIESAKKGQEKSQNRLLTYFTDIEDTKDDSWRCIQCNQIYTGDKFLFKTLDIDSSSIGSMICIHCARRNRQII